MGGTEPRPGVPAGLPIMTGSCYWNGRLRSALDGGRVPWLAAVWRRPAGAGSGAQLPVAANQAPPGEATNTMGAMHGRGRLIVALMSEFPAVLAGNWAVATLVTVAVPPAPMVWQLTMASKSGTGLVPCSAGGTGA